MNLFLPLNLHADHNTVLHVQTLMSDWFYFFFCSEIKMKGGRGGLHCKKLKELNLFPLMFDWL